MTMNPIPQLVADEHGTRLMVDGEPFFILSVQLDCDSCYCIQTMTSLMAEARKMGCNTVALLLYWRSIEPAEGQYDFSVLEAMLAAAEKNDLRIVLVWFGSYKNGCLHYAPDWVKKDSQRFSRVWSRSGKVLNALACPTCKETRFADQQAVCHVFHYLKERDCSRRVILFQVNNEIGIISSDRCYCPRCQEKFLQGHYDAGSQGIAQFSADCFLSYQEEIAQAAKKVYPLPCYLNAWLSGVSPASQPGQYPAGGPEPRVLHVYLQRKKAIDFVSPDVYTTGYRDFHRLCRCYAQPGNPLYIAEHSAGAHSRAEKNVFYALAYPSIGFDPWALDCAFPEQDGMPMVDARTLRWSDDAYRLAASYSALSDAMPLIAAHTGTDRLKPFVQEEGEWGASLSFGDTVVDVTYSSSTCDTHGCVIQLSQDRFAVVGLKASVSFLRLDGSRRTVLKSEKGVFSMGGRFVMERVNRREGVDPTRPVRMPAPGAYLITLEADA